MSRIRPQGVGSAPLHAGIHPPPGSEAGTPPGTRHTPLGLDTPWDQALPPWEQTSPLGSACWEIRATSGRYASYWNAILLSVSFYFLDRFYEELDVTLLHFVSNIFMDIRASEIAVENIDCIFNDAFCYNRGGVLYRSLIQDIMILISW